MGRPRKNKPVDNPDKVIKQPAPKKDDNGVVPEVFINDNGQIISTEGTFAVPTEDEFNGSTVANRIARQRAESIEKNK